MHEPGLTLILETDHFGDIAYASVEDPGMGDQLVALALRYFEAGLVDTFTIGPRQPLNHPLAAALMSRLLASREGRDAKRDHSSQ